MTVNEYKLINSHFPSPSSPTLILLIFVCVCVWLYWQEKVEAMSLAFVSLDFALAGIRRRRRKCTIRSVDMQEFREVGRVIIKMLMGCSKIWFCTYRLVKVCNKPDYIGFDGGFVVILTVN